MKTGRRSRSQVIADDVRDLERLGYAQQLFREMGGFSNFAISFSIISILTGAVLLFGYGLKLAGPVINSVRRIRRPGGSTSGRSGSAAGRGRGSRRGSTWSARSRSPPG
ncbi:MAG: hypothetical protein AUH18_02420 [Candidatus Rokubacteria bacterium 13_2_20CM_69_10]|nr:MAG: hypothetical protein AUH18_02420 [Candidatus Rokubacteria bacterium 13_2_20CM_69_10]